MRAGKVIGRVWRAIVKLSLWLSALLLAIVSGAVLVSYHPQWLVPLAEHVLKKQGIEARLSHLSGHWQLPNYRLQGRFSVPDNGLQRLGIPDVSIATARLDTRINLQARWHDKAFIEQLTLTEVQAEINVDTLRSTLSRQAATANDSARPTRATRAARTTPTEKPNQLQQVIPKSWAIDCQRCRFQSQQQTFDGKLLVQGQSDQTLNLIANDTRMGELSLQYDAQNQRISIQSPHLATQSFSGHPAVLSDMVAEIDLSAPWQSQLQANLSYQGLNSGLNNELNSQIRLYGEGENRLRLDTLTNDKKLSLTAERQTQQESPKHQSKRIIIRSDDIDTTLINSLKPVVLPLFSRHLSPTLRQQLQSLQIAGHVSGQVVLQPSRQSQRVYRLIAVDARLQQLSVSSDKRQLSNLSGTVVYTDNHLDFQIDLDKSTVNLPTLFSEALPPLNGQLHGTFDIHRQQLSMKNLTLNNKDFAKISAGGTLQLSEKMPIDLNATIDNLHVARLPLYLTKQFPPTVRTWLDNALRSGKKNRSTVKLKGDLTRFLRDENFVFTVDTHIYDGRFRYLKNNPDIAIKQAQVNIDGNQLKVNIRQADLVTHLVTKRKTKHKTKTWRVPMTGTVYIANMQQALIVVKAQVKPQPLSRLSQLAEHSLAQKSVRTVKSFANVKGHFSVSLDVWLNLASSSTNNSTNNSANDTDNTRFEVKLNSQNASAILKSYPNLPIKKAKTAVIVNQDGLQQLRIEGNALERPIAVELIPTKLTPSTAETAGQPNGYTVNIKAKKTNILQWLPRLDLLSLQQADLIDDYGLLRGLSDYHVTLRLKNNGHLVDIKVHSLLQATALNGFSLVVKGRKTRLPLNITYKASKRRLYVDLDRRFYLTLGMDNNHRFAGLLLDNRNTHHDYQAGLVRIIWNAKKLDAMKLKAFYDDWQKIPKNSKGNDKDNNKKSRLNVAIDITVDAVKLDANTAEPMQIKGNFDSLHIASPLLAGKLYYRENYLQADINRVEVDSLFNLFKKQVINPEGRKVTRFDFSSALPAMDIDIEQLIFKGNNVGKGSIHTSIQQEFYSIDQILIRGKNYYFDASGYEIEEPQGIATHLRLDFKGEDLSEVIRQFRLNEIVDAQFLDLSLNLSWPGEAHTINLRQSYGSAALNAQSVQMMTVSSGVGSVVGMMDIVGILKRIAMDFENLSSSKLSFDTIRGNWNIGGGRAMTRNAYATGSVVELKLVGGADLYRREFDEMDLTVIPKASNVIPLIGAVAGGVVGGAAGLLVQQALGDNINRAVGLPYVISGTWETPVVTYGEEEEEDS